MLLVLTPGPPLQPVQGTKGAAKSMFNTATDTGEFHTLFTQSLQKKANPVHETRHAAANLFL